MRHVIRAVTCGVALSLVACSPPTANTVDRASPSPSTATGTPARGPGPTRGSEVTSAAVSDAAAAPTPEPGPTRPPWLGTRVLPDGPLGWPEPVDTPPELRDRRLPPAHELLPPPPDDAFAGEVGPVTAEVAARSTWHEGCPVALADLAHLVVTFWGFDDRPHTGELIVALEVADDVRGVFERLYEARFPIEDLAIATVADLDAPPTGDGNVSGAFVCREARGTSRWSAHARGLAIDVNPFHNPYERDGRVLPELATAYLDRTDVRPGMILPGDVVTEAFADVGWTWGGDFRSLTDTMHFSATGD